MEVINNITSIPEVHIYPCPKCGDNATLTIARVPFKSGYLCLARCTTCKTCGNIKFVRSELFSDTAALIGWNEAMVPAGIADYKRGRGRIRSGKNK